MRVRKIILGLAAVATATVLAACSSGSTNSASGGQAVSPVANQSSAASAPSSTTSTSDSSAAPAPASSAPQSTSSTPPTSSTPSVVTKPAAQPAAASAPGVPCSGAAKACVDLSARKAWLVDNGQVVFGPVSIMPGSPSFPTPTGTFHVLMKDAMYHSKEFDNALMRDSVFFYPGDAFHVGSLGVYSHGCIHLSSSSAAQFFKTLSVGDEVQVIR